MCVYTLQVVKPRTKLGPQTLDFDWNACLFFHLRYYRLVMTSGHGVVTSLDVGDEPRGKMLLIIQGGPWIQL